TIVMRVPRRFDWASSARRPTSLARVAAFRQALVAPLRLPFGLPPIPVCPGLKLVEVRGIGRPRLRDCYLPFWAHWLATSNVPIGDTVLVRSGQFLEPVFASSTTGSSAPAGMPRTALPERSCDHLVEGPSDREGGHP